MAVSGDPLRLGQILLNLTGNAIVHVGRSVQVAVTAQNPAGNRLALRFTVRDTGIGIPESDRLRIFSAFVQADASTTRQYGGSGLGWRSAPGWRA